MAKLKRLSPGLCGVAGEYFVAAELSRRGYVASLTLRNTRGIDILASNADATRSVGIQVKTKQGGNPDWILSKKVELLDLAENLFFVVVTLNGVEEPRYYVVPRDKVIAFARHSHALWLRTPGKKGQAHKDNDMRTFKDPEGEHIDRWDLLGLDLAV